MLNYSVYLASTARATPDFIFFTKSSLLVDSSKFFVQARLINYLPISICEP